MNENEIQAVAIPTSCESCGANLREHHSHRYLVCDHCDRLHFLHAGSSADDNVTLLHRYVEAECQRCQRDLRHGVIEEVDVLFCDSCRGILIDRSQFQTALERRRSRVTHRGVIGKPVSPADLASSIACPSCAKKMERYPYLGGGSTVIDACDHCNLIWFDAGEFNAITIAKSTLQNQTGSKPASFVELHPINRSSTYAPFLGQAASTGDIPGDQGTTADIFDLFTAFFFNDEKS